MVKIINIIKDSIAEKLSLSVDDRIISINDNDINDRLDYNFYAIQRPIVLKIIKKPSRKFLTSTIND